MEEACAARVALEEDVLQAAEELATGGDAPEYATSKSSKSNKGVPPRPAYEGLDDDLLAASEYLKEPRANAEPVPPVPATPPPAAVDSASSSKQQTARSSAGETRR